MKGMSELSKLDIDTAYQQLAAQRKGVTGVGWDDPVFETARRTVASLFDRLTEQPKVEESGIKCKCGSTRTFSVQGQSRSADEGGTNYVVCLSCKKQWTFS